MKRQLILITTLFILTLTLHAQETQIVVRAKAKDAKFIGTSIGGAQIIIKDANTNEILAKGFTTGSTGNTNLIMKNPHERHKAISDDKTAKFETTLSLKEPVFATVEVIAPFAAKNAQVKAQTQLWLIPEKHLVGDGIVVEIPGFIVDILSPQRHSRISLSAQRSIDLTANIVMMCGCPITKGGSWDSENLSIQAIVKIDGVITKKVDMNIGDKASTFKGNIPITKKGNYEIILTVFNSKSGNTGVEKVNFIVND